MATTITTEQVLEAGKGAVTISEVARKLGLLKGKLDGKTGKMIRTAAPGLDGILKANREKTGSSTESTATKSGKVSPDTMAKANDTLTTSKSGASTESQGQFKRVSRIAEPSPDNPYRPGSTYAAIFAEGSKGFVTKGDLIERVAAITTKTAKCIGYSLMVLTHKAHSSNCGRSMALKEDGKIKLVSIRRRG